MYLEDIMDTALLREMRNKGYVKVQTHPDDSRFQILNYTDLATFDRVWNDVTRECRGLIIFGPENAYKTVVARPFAKFFNAGETEADQFRTNERVHVSDKVDGSLGILYTAPDGRPAIATRGSFASPQALHATALYRRKYEGHWTPHPDFTYLFEIVYPENRIVLDYGQMDDLVLLGTRHINSGAIGYAVAAEYFDNWKGPTVKSLGYMPFLQATLLADRKNAEGLVVRHGNRAVKIKQADYVALHKIVFGLTEKAVWERLRLGENTFQICENLPDEFHPWVGEVANRLTKAFVKTASHAIAINRVLSGSLDVSTREGKKEYAARVKASGYPHPGLLFMLRDGTDIAQAVWDLHKPKHRPFTTTNVQEAA